MSARPTDDFLTADEEELVVANLRLVPWVARRLMAGPDEFEDRVQDGMLGLMRAAQLYEPERGFKFATYAVPWIRQAIGRGRDIELGVNRRSALRAGREWQPPVALEASTTPDGRPIVEALCSSDDDPADVAERTLAVAPILAACRDDLDRAVVVAVATDVSLNSVAREHHVTSMTPGNRLDRIRATITGRPTRRKVTCVDCGGPCSKTRCRACFDALVQNELDRAAS